jgi:hypothetical protein
MAAALTADAVARPAVAPVFAGQPAAPSPAISPSPLDDLPDDRLAAAVALGQRMMRTRDAFAARSAVLQQAAADLEAAGLVERLGDVGGVVHVRIVTPKRAT